MPSPILMLPWQQPLSDTIAAQPGAKLYAWAAGTTTPKNTYQDNARTVAHTNPVVADAYGRFAPIFLDPDNGDYKIELRTSAEVVLRTLDNYPANPVGQPSYPRTSAEISAGITPTYTYYPELDVRRYGAVGDGAADDTTPFSRANLVAAAKSRGGTIRVPEGRYRITSSIALSEHVDLVGQGHGSRLEPDNCDCITLPFYSTFGKTRLMDFDINGTNCTTKKAIYQPGSLNDADELYGVTIQRVLVRNMNTAVSFRSVRVFTIENNWFENVNIGVDLTGKNLVGNVRGNEMVYGGGCGTGDKLGVRLQLFNFSGGSGNIGPEGINVTENHIYGFEYGVRSLYGFLVNIDNNDINATIRGIDFETVQYVLNIRGNYCEMVGANATQGIFGAGLSSTLTTKINIEGNAVGGASISSCSGIQINESGNQNQNYVSIVRNRIKQMTVNDIVNYNAGHGVIEDNNCESSAPTNSISVTAVTAGTVHVRGNICAKEISVPAADVAAGKVVVGTNYVNGTTIRVGAQVIPTVASASAVTLPIGCEAFIISGTTNITSIVATGWTGRIVRLIFQDVLTFTDGSNLKLAGNFVTSADDSITLLCDGTNFYELARSVN